MKSTFKITYRHGNGDPTHLSRLIEANSSNEALKILGPVHSIRSISMQCKGTTTSGEPCQRFTQNDYCCEAHDPRYYQFETSVDLDAREIVYSKFKGSTHYGEERFTIDEAKGLFERGANVARCPRTTMVDRLIALDWDIDALIDHYEQEARDRAVQSRRESFRITITPSEQKRYYLSDADVRITHNGWQWQTVELTIDEARALRGALDAYLEQCPGVQRVDVTLDEALGEIGGKAPDPEIAAQDIRTNRVLDNLKGDES